VIAARDCSLAHHTQHGAAATRALSVLFLFLFLLLYSFALRAHNVRVRGVPLCTITTRLQLQYAYRSLLHPQRDDVVLVC